MNFDFFKTELTESCCVQCADGEHKIRITQENKRKKTPIQIYVDGRITAKVPVSSAPFLKTERVFECGGENLKMVYHGHKVDILHNNRFVINDVEHGPKNRLPIWSMVLIVAVILASLSLVVLLGNDASYSMYELFLCPISVLACAGIAMQYATIPFFTPKKKLVHCMIVAAYTWALVALVVLGVNQLSSM